MTDTLYDILGLGNAIVDIIAQTPDAFLAEHALVKGSMALIGEERAERLLAAMGSTSTISGGSAANTVIGAAGLGCSASFIGKVRNDGLGDLFTADIEACRRDLSGAARPRGADDCTLLHPRDARRSAHDEHLSRRLPGLERGRRRPGRRRRLPRHLSRRLPLGSSAAKDAFRKASRIAHEAGRTVALSLSDSFCVNRYRDEFLDLITSGAVDVVFANEAEVASLVGTSSFDEGIAFFQAQNVVGALTRSEKGCVVVAKGQATPVPAAPIEALVDTTGAGDLFAAGFVTGLVRGLDHVACARLGALAAAEIIQHIGARPKSDLRALAKANGITL